MPEIKEIRELDWHPKFVVIGRVGRQWIFMSWIEARTDYYRPLLEHRRLYVKGASKR
jgi:hypothetical protein